MDRPGAAAAGVFHLAACQHHNRWMSLPRAPPPQRSMHPYFLLMRTATTSRPNMVVELPEKSDEESSEELAAESATAS